MTRGSAPKLQGKNRRLTKRDKCGTLTVVKLNRHTLTVIRERSRLSKAELASRCLPPVDRTLITRIENGERLATADVIYRIATALDVSPLALCDSTTEAMS